MTTKTVVLKEGVGICELRPIDGGEDFGSAQVLGGTVGRKGDILRKPADLTWEEAAQETTPGRTALSPFDLEVVHDSITHQSFIPEGGLEELCALYDAARQCESAADEAEYREALSLLLSQEEDGSLRVTSLRRRKADVA